MKNLKRLGMRSAYAFLAYLLQTSTAVAAETDFSGPLLEVRIDASGKGLLYIPPVNSGGHALCRYSYNNHLLAFDTNTAGGKAMLRVARSAQIHKRQIRAVGTGACSIYTGIEDLNTIYVN